MDRGNWGNVQETGQSNRLCDLVWGVDTALRVYIHSSREKVQGDGWLASVTDKLSV